MPLVCVRERLSGLQSTTVTRRPTRLLFRRAALPGLVPALHGRYGFLNRAAYPEFKRLRRIQRLASTHKFLRIADWSVQLRGSQRVKFPMSSSQYL